jgi:hypothetical protein
VSDSDDLGQLETTEWDLLQEQCARVEAACRNRQLIDLVALLPPAGTAFRLIFLHELIKTELAARWEFGQRCLLEEFLRRYRDLGSVASLPARLIYEEYRARHGRKGDRPPLEQYRQRFPWQFEELQQLLRAEPVGGTEYGTLQPENGTRTEPPQVAQTRVEPPQAGPTPDSTPETKAPPSPKKPTSPGETTQILLAGEGYRLLERIGHGQFGEVYRALAPGGVEVAIKRIFRTLDDETSQRELQAQELLKQLHHCFLLDTHSFWSLEDRLIIVMQMAEGSLKDRFKACAKEGKTGIPAKELVGYVRDAAEALDYLHEQQPPLVHRDIKPQNILLLKGHAKVADFGLVRLLERDLVAGTLCGTPLYMPPETLGKTPLTSVHGDQYSLAVTYFEMRLGRPLFTGGQHQVWMQHLQETPDLSGLPEAEQAALNRALAKDPNQRYPNCLAFAEALSAAASPPPPAPPKSSTPSAWQRPLLAVLGVSLVVALAILAAYLFKPRAAWKPKGWEAVGSEMAEDVQGKKYFKRLFRTVGDNVRVEVVLVPQTRSTDPPTFYAMEHKVWNELFEQFMNDPAARRAMDEYAVQWPQTVNDEWRKGAYDGKKDLGVEGEQKRVPVMRVTVTQAHFFAVWLGGKLPSREQWFKALGKGEDPREGPVDGSPRGPDEIAVFCWGKGPWSIDQPTPDVTIWGCWSMGSNGKEWTRSLDDGGKTTVPVSIPQRDISVTVLGQSYLAREPLRFKKYVEGALGYFDVNQEVGFRVVLDQE